MRGRLSAQAVPVQGFSRRDEYEGRTAGTLVDVIVVMAATGNTGHVVVNELLSMGERVRVLGRSVGMLQPFVEAGCEALAGDATDAAYLTTAFAAADAVYTLLSDHIRAPDIEALHDRMGEAIIQAIRDSGVRHVVFVSSHGADLPEGTDLITSLHKQEERLRALPGVSVLVLRNGWFFENFFGSIDLIRAQGINGGAIAPDVAIPMIAARDIGRVAAAALHKRDFDGFTVRELLGERDLTFPEATHILGARIGLPGLRYVQIPYPDYTKMLVQAGFSPNVAELFTEMSRAVNEGKTTSREGRTAASTTPTTFETFADEFAEAYRAAGA